MKIGIEAQRLFRRKKHGMEIVALEITRQVQQLDQKNDFVLFVADGADDGCIKPTRNFLIQKLKTSFFPIWEQKTLPKAAKDQQVDVLHCTANTAPMFCNIPMVITVHDLIYLNSISFSGSAYQNFGNLYRRYIVPIVARKAAIIITVSEFEKKNIASKLKISPEKIRVIYNGVNPQFAPVTHQEKLKACRVKYHLPDQYLLHFGNTSPRKNTAGVLQAYALYKQKYPSALPLVITSCDSEFINKLLKQIGHGTLIDSLVIPGYMDAADIPLLYNMAKVFLCPSHSEGFGMPVVESMACGIPVITSNTTALPEVAGGAAALVDPFKPNEIFDAIERLLTDTEYYNSKKEAGFINAARFSWVKAAETTLAIYKELGN